MPLDYVDFAHHYEGQSLTEVQKRSHFETLADLLDCIVRLFWSDTTRAKELGITLEPATFTDGKPLDSSLCVTSTFNDAACILEAGKQAA